MALGICQSVAPLRIKRCRRVDPTPNDHRSDWLAGSSSKGSNMNAKSHTAIVNDVLDAAAKIAKESTERTGVPVTVEHVLAAMGIVLWREAAKKSDAS